VTMQLQWHVVSNPGVNFQAAVSGGVKMGSADKGQPSGNLPVAKTLTGVYQHVLCTFSTPQPLRGGGP